MYPFNNYVYHGSRGTYSPDTRVASIDGVCVRVPFDVYARGARLMRLYGRFEHAAEYAIDWAAWQVRKQMVVGEAMTCQP